MINVGMVAGKADNSPGFDGERHHSGLGPKIEVEAGELRSRGSDVRWSFGGLGFLQLSVDDEAWSRSHRRRRNDDSEYGAGSILMAKDLKPLSLPVEFSLVVAGIRDVRKSSEDDGGLRTQ